MIDDEQIKQLAKLRDPFAANQVGLLPKQVKRDDQDKGKCSQGSKYSADGKVCGGWHARSVHLDFVGHAALTDRLLEVDSLWSWEPLALNPVGLPAMDGNGGLWIKLTVCGVTRLGYGDAAGKQGANAVKEVIGDALRNAAMRFGAALDLWHKGDLHDTEVAQGTQEAPAQEVERADPGVDTDGKSASVLRGELETLCAQQGWDANTRASEFADIYRVSARNAQPWQLQEFLTAMREIATEKATS